MGEFKTVEYDDIDITKIKNGWVITLGWRVKGKDGFDYESDKVFCKDETELVAQFTKWIVLLEKKEGRIAL